MPRINELKKGSVVEINGVPHRVKTYDVRNPSSRGASTMYKVRFNNLKTGQKVDETFKGEDMIKEVETTKVSVMYSYIDGDNYVFMDTEDYTQHSLSTEDLGDQAGYITEGMEEFNALLLDGTIIGVELPSIVVLEVVETAPKLKGASATNRNKPATLNTGIEVMVPEYLEVGEMVKVHTATGEFLSRD